MNELREESSNNPIESYSFLAGLYEYKYTRLKEYDEDIYRVEAQTRISPNDALGFGFYGVNHSSSAYSGQLYDFLKKLGYSQQHVSVVSDFGNTKAVDMLFGIKYIVSPKSVFGKEDYEVLKIDNNLEVYKNPYALSLAFSAPESVLKEISVNDKNTFEYQNNILSNIANLEDNIFVKQNGEIKRTLENLTQDRGEYKKIDEGKEAKLTYEFEAENEGECYIYISSGSSLEGLNIYIDGKKLNLKYTGDVNKMIGLGRHEVGEMIRIDFVPKGNEFGLYDEYVYYEDDMMIQKYYEELSKEQVKLEEISGDKYNGKIDIKSDNEYVLFTIPYDEGWSAEVDRTKN